MKLAHYLWQRYWPLKFILTIEGIQIHVLRKITLTLEDESPRLVETYNRIDVTAQENLQYDHKFQNVYDIYNLNSVSHNCLKEHAVILKLTVLGLLLQASKFRNISYIINILLSFNTFHFQFQIQQIIWNI